MQIKQHIHRKSLQNTGLVIWMENTSGEPRLKNTDLWKSAHKSCLRNELYLGWVDVSVCHYSLVLNVSIIVSVCVHRLCGSRTSWSEISQSNLVMPMPRLV